MTKWIKYLAAGALLTGISVSCTITEVDDEVFDDDGAGRAGRGGSSGGKTSTASGGTAAGRSGSGGSASGSGGKATGGSSGTGGQQSDVPEDVSCDDPEGTEPAESCEFGSFPAGEEDCLTCLSDSCCTELKACYATEPHDRCGYGPAPDDRQEFLCYLDCLVETARASENKIYTEDDRAACATQCVTAVDGSGRACTALIGDRSNEVINCAHDNCDLECLDEPINAP